MKTSHSHVVISLGKGEVCCTGKFQFCVQHMHFSETGIGNMEFTPKSQ